MMTCFRVVGRRLPVAALAVAVAVLVVSGCGGAGDDFKGERGTVTGKVTYKGKPIPKGSSVLFQSETGSFSAGGITNENGEFSLLYKEAKSVPGVKYLVQIAPPPVPVVNTDPAKPPEPGASAPPLPFPVKYIGTGTSGLSFTVKAGANSADFELVD